MYERRTAQQDCRTLSTESSWSGIDCPHELGERNVHGGDVGCVHALMLL